MTNFTKGEVVVFTDHYDLFDIDMKDKEGMFYKMTMKNKCLVLDPISEEWAEPCISILKQKNLDMSQKNMLNFVLGLRQW